LGDGANTSTINSNIGAIDRQLNDIKDPAKKQAVIEAMDKELSDKGLLPSALQVFAQQNDNHKILKADRRGVHADTLNYILHPDEFGDKLKGGHWNEATSPVEMMLTRELYKNVNNIMEKPPAKDGELPDNGEMKDWRLTKFAQRADEHNSDVTNTTTMLKQFGSGREAAGSSNFYDIAGRNNVIDKRSLQNALELPGTPESEKPTIKWMKDNFGKISDHGVVTPASMNAHARDLGLDPGKIIADGKSETAAAAKATADKEAADKAAAEKLAASKAEAEKAAEKAAVAAGADAIHKRDQHVVKKGEKLWDIAAAELRAEGKLSDNPADAKANHAKIAYEAHLIRLYTPEIYRHHANENGTVDFAAGKVLNFKPIKQIEQELEANRLRHQKPADMKATN
jgi:hypothetical protein